MWLVAGVWDDVSEEPPGTAFPLQGASRVPVRTPGVHVRLQNTGARDTFQVRHTNSGVEVDVELTIPSCKSFLKLNDFSNF